MANATLRVQFGTEQSSEVSGHLSAEIDTRPDGLNGGRSSFNPGETVYILIYRSSNVRITETICSAGSLSAHSRATVQVEQELLFEDNERASLNKPAKASLQSVAWFGRSLGELTLQSDKTTVRAALRGVGVARVRYDADADVYALQSPGSLNGESDFSILAIIKGAAQ